VMAGLPTIVQTLRDMPVRNKVILLAVLAVAAGSLIFGLTWIQKSDYQVLYSNLSEEDAGQIVQKLQEQKIPYRAAGGSVMVPSDRVYDLRLQLASQGIPQGGGIGFELFDKTTFTTTDFVQKLNYRRALQGELSRTVRALAEVEQCRIHLAVPEKSLFQRDDDRPKASVLVKLRPGRRLSQGQVQGIVHLVSSSVEGLQPRDVAVVDQQGEMLTTTGGDILGMTNSQLEFQRGLEKDLEQRILGILEPVVGKGKARAKVAALVDFRKVEKTEERFDPDGQIVRSEQRNLEKSATGKTSGVPGVTSNVPAKSAPQGSSNQTQTEKKTETVNYEISKVTSHVVTAPGEIRKLSVAVLVDGTSTAQAGAKERAYKPRTEEELRQIEDTVKRVVGFTAERGDEVRVVNMPFETSVPEELAEGPREIMPIIATAARYLVPLVAVVLLFLFVLRPLIKILGVSSAATSRMELPKTVAELERALELPERNSRERVVEWARQNPQQAASLIKGWIQEK